MVLGAITGVPTPACLSAASNPVEAVTPPCGSWQKRCIGHSKNYFQYSSLGFRGAGNGERRNGWGRNLYNVCDRMPLPRGAGYCALRMKEAAGGSGRVMGLTDEA
jgi:hypothetical protein